jgi:hypothetical protein
MKKISKNTKAIKIIMPTDEEDRAITLAALSDPDNQPLTDEDFAKIKKIYRFGDVMPKASDFPTK